jgi:hypothetical protein
MTSSRNYHHGFYGDCNISVENETVNFLNTETLFNKTEIYNLIQNIRDMANKNKNKRVNFDV